MKTTKTERPKFGRIHWVREIYGLPDATIYRLIQGGLVRSVDVRRPGCSRGTRLVDLESLDNYLSDLAKEQSSDAA